MKKNKTKKSQNDVHVSDFAYSIKLNSSKVLKRKEYFNNLSTCDEYIENKRESCQAVTSFLHASQ